MNIVIATIKSWNIEAADQLKKEYASQHEVYIFTENNELTVDSLRRINPEFVFFPHWSWIIPKEIFDNYNCVVFHSTDLPFGRGGSPLQNLIARGIYKTKVSAIKVCDGVDTGPIYLKEPIDISEGNADQIFRRISSIIFEKMIPKFLESSLIPTPQTGEVVSFKRRRPEDSEIPDGLSQRQIYDYIRMLDGEGYPPAFRRYGDLRIVYKDAEIIDNTVTAKATIVGDSEDK